MLLLAPVVDIFERYSVPPDGASSSQPDKDPGSVGQFEQDAVIGIDPLGHGAGLYAGVGIDRLAREAGAGIEVWTNGLECGAAVDVEVEFSRISDFPLEPDQSIGDAAVPDAVRLDLEAVQLQQLLDAQYIRAFPATALADAMPKNTKCCGCQ
jgi:hypothetical protein